MAVSRLSRRHALLRQLLRELRPQLLHHARVGLHSEGGDTPCLGPALGESECLAQRQRGDGQRRRRPLLLRLRQSVLRLKSQRRWSRQ